MPNLTEFADETFLNFKDNRLGGDLAQAGPISRRIASVIGSEAAASLVATRFWQTFFSSPALFATMLPGRMREVGTAYSGLARAERMVVARPKFKRFDLLAFVPGLEETQVFEVKGSPADLAPDVSGLISGEAVSGSSQDVLSRAVALEAVNSGQPFGIILAKPPRTQPCKGVPSACSVVQAGSEIGSVGLVVRRMSNSDEGITTAAHVTAGASAGASGTRTAQVGAATGTIEVENLLADAAFVKLAASDLPTMGVKGARGVMKNVLPRGHEPVEFEAMRADHSGREVSTVLTAHVTSWSLELPNVDLRNQLKVYTTLQTEGGDSGAAIVNGTDYVLGFAHERCDDIQTFSSWIWAEQVMLALDVEAL